MDRPSRRVERALTEGGDGGRGAPAGRLRRAGVRLLYGLLTAAAVYVLVRNLDSPNDFRHFRDFGLAALAGQFPYDPVVEEAWYDGTWATWPPSFLPVAILLARLDAVVGQGPTILLWQAANLAGLAFVLALWVRWLYGRRLSLGPFPGEASSPIGGTSPPVDGTPSPADRLPLWSLPAMVGLLVPARVLLSNFEHTQANLLVLGLAAAGFALLRRGRRAGGGLALGLATGFKATALLLVPYLAWRGRWRDLGATAAGGAVAWGVLPTLAVGPGDVGRWYAAWWERTRALELPTSGMNQSLQATLTRLWAPEGPFVAPGPAAGGLGGHGAEVWVVAGVAVLGLAGALAFGRPLRPVSRRREALELGVVFAAMGLLSPLGWKAHFVGLAPLALALYAVLPRAARWRGGRDGGLGGPGGRAVAWALVGAGAAINLSATGVVGGGAADLLEAYGAVTWPAALLILAGLGALAAGRRDPAMTGSYPSPSASAPSSSPGSSPADADASS